MSFHVGITGTREGMTPRQLGSFIHSLQVLFNENKRIRLHHGDCVGVDAAAHNIFWAMHRDGDKINIHPQVADDMRANCRKEYGVKIHTPRSYLERDRNIVDLSDVLIAIPREMEHQSRGGTWYTYDYAIKKNIRIYLILPDGTIK